MADIKAPVGEIGNPGNVRPILDMSGKTVYVPRQYEQTWDLRWPESVKVYSYMHRSDGQVGSVIRACTLPIVSAHWTLDDQDVRPEVADFVRQELGLTLPTESRTRVKHQGVVFREHVREALKMLVQGHMFFEQVYSVDDPETDQAGNISQPVIHLRKIAPRQPESIRRILVAEDGGLQGIIQAQVDPLKDLKTLATGGVFIPVDRLVAYVLERDGADWTGLSLLRAAYKHWLLKDQLIKIDAQGHERNSMGIPVITLPEGATAAQKAEAQEIVEGFRAGAEAGATLPATWSLQLLGVTGSTSNPLPSIEYHDQSIAKNALAMFLDLGHDAGARSLGDTFVDVFTSSLQYVADLIADIATEHIVRDLVALNWGEDEPYPRINAGDLSANRQVAAQTLATLADSGIIIPDDELEEYVRAKHGLPAKDPATAREPEGPPDTPDTPLERAQSIGERIRNISEARS